METLNNGCKYVDGKDNTWHWQNTTVALKDDQSQITNNTDEAIKVADEFYRKVHSSNDKQTEDPSKETRKIELPV